MADSRPVFERNVAIRAVHALMQPQRPALPGHRRPVVVFEGAHGSGKTVLLDVLAEKIGPHIPHGRADLADPLHEDVPTTLSTLAAGLAGHRPRYGRLRFPRLLIGLLVLQQDLAHLDFEQAREDVRQLLAQRRTGGWPQRFLRDLAAGPLEVGLSAGVVSTTFQVPLRGIGTVVGHTFPDRARSWYGHRDRELPDQPIDTLVRLSRSAHDVRREEPGEVRHLAARAQVDGLLCEAFLADLRDASRRVHTLQSPVVLLDNADTLPGRTFLRRLLDARPPLSPSDSAEPLTVVATAREELPEMADAPCAPLESVLDQTAPRVPAGGTPPVWLRYRLPDLSRADIQTLMDTPAARADRRLARLVHTYTGGHPQAAGLLAASAARHPEAPGGVVGLLVRPVPGAGPEEEPAADTAEEWLLRRLLAADGPPPEGAQWEGQATAFAAGAAACREVDALWLSHQEDLVDPAWADGVRRARLWDAAGPSGTVMLRRLLLRRLAARAPEDPVSWGAVYQRLAAYCRERDDLRGALSYQLAEDDLPAVAGELSRLLPDMAGRAWLDLLRTVAEAPCGSLERQLMDPYTHFSRMVQDLPEPASDDVTAHVARLLTALRIVGDPAGGVERGFLHTQISHALTALALHSPDGLVALHEAADDYARQARWWM
ncbi:hypothetical protein V1J52_08280 [Streptomyces sp. TRM 70351]|uniref:hypothetical protein n=1 Tax=Streptomyces sp. TRM 70351 TaxID=3116552 RepID=UPI002E7B69C6|nr:hypothetical protein [Streptomyces sp. TRM 70351]MEE1928190.1 hypothetical protein [Streptomyces sp. TRM 70351]